MNYGMIQSEAKSVGGPRPQSLRERLDWQRRELRERLADLDAAAEALDGNPDLERLLNLVSRV